MKYLTYLNSGCKSICDNMLISAKNVGISSNDFIIVAFDRPIFDYYLSKGYQTELFEDVPEEVYHNWTWDENSKFRQLVKNKWFLIKKYFTDHKPLMWLDTDIVFLKNPEEYVKDINEPTFQIDYPVKCACTGLMYFPECELSNQIIDTLGNQNTEDDQIVCNNLLRNNMIQNKVSYFNLDYFPNGGYFYDAKGTTLDEVVMLHCNYVVGLETKINRLKQSGVWYL